jgi:hypothetical protein
VSADIRHNIAQGCQEPSVSAEQNNTFVPAWRARESVACRSYTMNGATLARDASRVLSAFASARVVDRTPHHGPSRYAWARRGLGTTVKDQLAVSLASWKAWAPQYPRSEVDSSRASIPAKRRNPFAVIFSRQYVGRIVIMSALLTISIIGLWAGAVYEPTAIIFLSRAAGMDLPSAAKMVSYGTGLLSIGTILRCIAATWLAERVGRRPTLAPYYLGIMVAIATAFGWAFYLPVGTALLTFMAILFFLGLFGGNFAIFSLWLPELFGTEVRGTAFAFRTWIGRFIGAGVNFALAAGIAAMSTLGTPIALTAIAFGVGLLVIPFARETHGELLPD